MKPSKIIKSQIDSPQKSSLGPWLWLSAGFVVSLVSLVYYFFQKRSKSQPREKETIASPLPALPQVREVEAQPFQPDNTLLLWVSLAALILAVAGQFFIRAERIWIGVALSVAAVCLFVIAFWRQPGPLIRLNTWTSPVSTPKSAVQIGIPALGASVLLAGLSFWLFGKEEVPSIYPWLLHFASVGSLIFASFHLAKFNASAQKSENEKRWTMAEAGLFVLILAIAAFMRLYRFDQIPFGFWYDEADNGLSALSILTQPGYLPVFVKSTNLPAHYLYLIAFVFQTIGISTLTLRTVSVAFGLATVAASYFLGSELFNRRMGFVLAFFLAVSRWDVNWSRIGMHGVSVPFFEILSMVLLLRALRRQNLLDYSLAGLSLGLGLCFYTPLYVFPFVVAAFLLVLWANRHDLVLVSWRGFFIVALGFLIVSVPISQFALRQTESFSGRLNVTSIFTGKTVGEGWRAVGKTTQEHLVMFHYSGDNNGRHNLPGEPMLDLVSGTLMLLGFALSLRRIRQPASFLSVAWLLIMLMPGIFSLDFESPQSLRAIGSLPAANLLAVIPIHALWQEWENSSVKRSRAAFVLQLVPVLLVMGYLNYHVYFDLQAQNADTWRSFSTPETLIGRAMDKLRPQTDFYISIFYHNSPTVLFLAPDITNSFPLVTYDTLPIPLENKRRTVFFIDLDREPFFRQAQQYYPNADFKEYKDTNGSPVLYQVTLDPSDIEASQGITVSYYPDANWQEPPVLVETKSAISADWKDGETAQSVKWQGVIFADRFGVYRFSLQSPSPTEMYLDEAPIQLKAGADGTFTAEVELAKGSHNLVLKTQAAEGHFELQWQPPEGELVSIPSSRLYLPPISNNGLLGYYYENGDWQAPPAYLQIDPWIHYYYHTQPLQRPYTIEWVGRIKIEQEGDYVFWLESYDESMLYIDEQLVTSAYQEGTIHLSPGFHPIRLRYADRTGYTHINFYWKPPDAERESVPQEVLFLP